MRALLPILILLAAPAACRDEKRWNVGEGSSTPPYQRVEDDPTLLGNTVVPVRVGELGPSFAACNAEGRVRDFDAGGPIPVRAAPYDQARERGQLAVGSSFFICSRSLDQRWLGIVYAQGGRADRSCGVAAPIAQRRDYDGNCESGWVSSAQVQLVGRIEDTPVQASQNVAQPNVFPHP